MGIRDAWRALFAKEETGRIFSDPENLDAGLGILRSQSFTQPPPRGARELTIAGQKSAVLFAVTEKIGTTVGSATWKAYVMRSQDGGVRFAKDVARADMRERRKALADANRLGELEEIPQHPILDVLDRPNPYMVGQGFRSLTQRLLDLNGEVFWIKERNGAGMPVQLYPVPSYWCFRTPFLNAPTYQFTYGAWTTFAPESEVIWLKHPNAENPYGRGVGLGNAVGDQVEIYEYGHKVAKQAFYNNAVPAGILSMTSESGVPPTKEQVDAVKERWEAQHRGIWNQMKLAWVGWKAQFTQLQPKFADAQLMELIKQSRDEIVQTFGVPPEILGIGDNSNRAKAVTAQSVYVQNVVVPRLEFLRNALQTQLVPEYDENIVIDYVPPAPDDQDYQLQVMTAAPEAFKVNEWRDQAGKVLLDGDEGEAFFSPTAGAAPGGSLGSLEPGPGKADPAWARSLPRRSLRQGR